MRSCALCKNNTKINLRTELLAMTLRKNFDSLQACKMDKKDRQGRGHSKTTLTRGGR